MLKFQFPFVCAFVLFASSIQAADVKEDVVQAAKALGQKENYSWRTTVATPPDSRFRPGPTDGKTEKDGATYLKMSVNDNTTEAVIKGQKFAMNGQDGWQSSSDLENAEGSGRFMAARLRNFKLPAEQAGDILKDVKELKKDGDVYSGDLTEEGAKNLMRFRRGGGDGPEISNAKGNARFWVKDGVLAKYEFKVKGSMSFNGNDVEIDRTTTTEIKDAGTTTVTIPEAAQKKLS